MEDKQIVGRTFFDELEELFKHHRADGDWLVDLAREKFETETQAVRKMARGEGSVYMVVCEIGYGVETYRTLALARPFPDGSDTHWQYMHLAPEVPYDVQKLHQVADSEVVELLSIEVPSWDIDFANKNLR